MPRRKMIGFLLLIATLSCGRLAPDQGKNVPVAEILSTMPAPNPTLPVLITPAAPESTPGIPESTITLPDGEGARLLMLFSHQRWQSLWADGQIDDYASGGQTPAQSRHIQVWIQQPGMFRSLIGRVGGAPEDMWVGDGQQYRQRGAPANPMAVDRLQPFQPSAQLSDSINPHPLEGMLGSPIGGMIFPAGIAQRQGIYQVLGFDSYLNRTTVVLDWSFTEGAISDRLWIDYATGIVLRWQNFGKGGLQGLNSEMTLNQLVFNVDLPIKVFDIHQSMPASFAVGYAELP